MLNVCWWLSARTQVKIAKDLLRIVTMSSAECGLRISTTTLALYGLMLGNSKVFAQVVSDRTTNTQVTVERNFSEVTGGVQKGNNLFHSFKQFSLDTNDVVNFDHSLDVDHIFSRVTGGGVSQIDGLIQTQGNANLFLINPAGIIFGANAQLDIAGSFIASTAESLVFADGTQFSAIAPNTAPILTISAPVGLQYGNTGDITILPNANRGGNTSGSGLGVQPDRTLALLGGEVSLTRNSLNSDRSNIEIASVKYGTIQFNEFDAGWQFNYDATKELGTIELTDRALVNSSGIVNLSARKIDFDFSSGIRNFTNLNSPGGKIQLTATESIRIDNSFLFTQVGQVIPDLEAIANSGGDITIQTPQIEITNGSIVSAGTFSQGAGGNILLNASESISISSNEISNPAIVSTSTQGLGTGGKIEVNTGRLSIDGGSQIQALAGQGSGGTIEVMATESIVVSGTGILRSLDSQRNITETLLKSGFSASSGLLGLPRELQPEGESGSLVITTPELTVQDSASISVNNYGISNAGDIKIEVANLKLDTQAEITANTASGSGGSIDIAAQELVFLDRGATITTAAEQSGDGGNIFLSAENLVLFESNRISANAPEGKGGNITINTQGLFNNYHVEPNITASSRLKTNNGTIKIITLDLDSRLITGYQEYNPLMAQDYIGQGCGVGSNDTASSFRNVGRGGIVSNPTTTVSSLETLEDIEAKSSDPLMSSSTKVKNNLEVPKSQAITEASTWKINSHGKIELIATHENLGIGRSHPCSF